MTIHTFSFPTLIHFGPRARFAVADHLKEKHLSRPLVITDRELSTLPVFKEFFTHLENGLHPAPFAGVFGNPAKNQVIEGVKAFHAHKADSIIAFGGGATLDVAKAVALMARHPGDLFDYEDGKPDALAMDKEIPYWVGIPTTAGTGSEVGRSAVISDDETHVKKIIFSPRLLARAVFADPEVTLALPPKLTAATGMDALTHCVESYLAKDYHPICDGIALEGLKLVSQSLVRCFKTPSDLEARGSMLIASMMGAIAFQKGLGLTHSCAHALSTVADLHHGLGNGIMIDHALAFNAASVPTRFEQLAMTVGLEHPGADVFLMWLKELKTKVRIPHALSDVGIKKSQIEALANAAFADGCHQNNPCPVTLEDFCRIFSQAL